MELVQVTIEDSVALVTLNRPNKVNALSLEMFDALTEIGCSIRENKSIRAVVLTGAGGNFSAGIDIGSLGAEIANNDNFARNALALTEGEIANKYQKPAYVWREIDIPVIAALEGVAFGGGCQIALAADIRLAAPDVRMSVMEIKWGLIPDMSLSTTLPHLVRKDVAMELTLSGRIVEAEEAAALGLVSRVTDTPLDDALAMAHNIANRSPDAIRRSKALLRPVCSLEDAKLLRREAELQSEIIGMPNQEEAVWANLQGRKPRFLDSAE